MSRIVACAARAVAWGAGFAPALALATPVELCMGNKATPGVDGRVLGHIPYIEAQPIDLIDAPPGFAINGPCKIHRDAAPDLTRMLRDAAAVPGVGSRLRGVSCHRTVQRQRWVFCSQIGPKKRCKNAAERARFVGPPGYSEHATGYAIDFGIRPSPGCADVTACIAATPAGKWLLANAPAYGFELSFPAGNAQSVTWEPWHWRWVGSTIDGAGAARARLVFARARADFAARPAVTDRPDQWLSVITRPPPRPAAPPPLLRIPPVVPTLPPRVPQ